MLKPTTAVLSLLCLVAGAAGEARPQDFASFFAKVGWLVLGSLASEDGRSDTSTNPYVFTLSHCRVMSLRKLFVYSSTVAISEKSFLSAARPRPWNCTCCSCFCCCCCWDGYFAFSDQSTIREKIAWELCQAIKTFSNPSADLLNRASYCFSYGT